jgi:hypothetical protein
VGAKVRWAGNKTPAAHPHHKNEGPGGNLLKRPSSGLKVEGGRVENGLPVNRECC